MTKAQEIANSILVCCGGASNISDVNVCTTRIRIVVKNNKTIDIDKLKKNQEITSVINVLDQIQIVIGSLVHDVYAELNALLGSTSKPKKVPKKIEKHNLLSKLLLLVIEVYTPTLGIICAAGILHAITSLGLAFNIFTTDNIVYKLLNLSSDAVFIFFPALIAYTSAKIFLCNPIVPITIALTLMYGRYINFDIEIIRLFNILDINITPFNGFSTFSISAFSIIVTTYLNSIIEKFLRKNIKFFNYEFFYPLCSFIIMVPISFVLIGEVFAFISNICTDTIQHIYNLSPAITSATLGGIWQILVSLGIHWILIPSLFESFFTNHYDVFQPIMAIAVCSQSGVCLAILLNIKGEKRNFSAFFVSLFGISEPALFGYNLKYKRNFFTGCLIAAIFSFVASFFSPKYYALGLVSFSSLTRAISVNGFDPTFTALFLCSVSAITLSFIITYIQMKLIIKSKNNHLLDKNKTIKNFEETGDTNLNSGALQIGMPITGELINLSDIKDPIFSTFVLGDGIGIIPEENIVYAPCDGIVATDFESKHAIGILHDKTEVFIHVGIDTVKLGGKYFNMLVKKDQKIKMGEPLLSFDIDAIKNEGYDTSTVLIITNMGKFKTIKNASNINQTTQKGQIVLQLS